MFSSQLKNSGFGHQGFDESIQSLDINQRIIAKLESMKSNQIISMPDSFLGDEGCRVLVDFFHHNSHNHISKLDLKGNNIGERGACFLAQLFQENDSIKKLSLEWNSIGLSETGLATLCASLYHNTSLLEIDLRNNQISQHGASIIADLIRSNKTLKKIDLKWNEIGKQGATLIFQAVQDNTMIQYVELSGNKGAEDVIRVMESVLERNRGEVGGLIKPLIGVNNNGNEVPFDILRKQGEYAEDLKAKYDAQVIAHTRTEKRIKEIEKQKDSENRQAKARISELTNSLESEKIARNSVQGTLSKLKEDFARSELEKDKLIIDLQNKYDKAKIERSQIELELNKNREAWNKSEQINQNKVLTLEDQLSKIQSMYGELDESSKIMIEKLRKEVQQGANEVQKQYQTSLKKKDENIRSLTTEVDSLNSQINQLRTESLSRKADEELRLNELMKELAQVQRQFHDSLTAEQEEKLRLSQSHGDRISRIQLDNSKELEQVKQAAQRDDQALRKQIDEITKEKNQLQIENAKYMQNKNKQQQDLIAKEGQISQLNERANFLDGENKRIKNREAEIKAQAQKEIQVQIKSLETQRDEYKNERDIRQVENQKLMDEIQKLSEKLKVKNENIKKSLFDKIEQLYPV